MAMYQKVILRRADKLRENDPKEYVKLSSASMKKHVEAMLAFQEKGAIAFDYEITLDKLLSMKV